MIKLKDLIKEVKVEKIEYPLIKQSNGVYKEGSFDWHNFIIGKFYEDGDVLRYILSQHHEFVDDDRVEGIFIFVERDPNDIDESEWDVNDWKVEHLAKSNKEYPPIVIDANDRIIDGGHRLAAAVKRGDKTIKLFQQYI